MGTPRNVAAKEKNWDSYGADPTTEMAIKAAEQMNNAWGPNKDGGLTLEYVAAGGRELLVDIDENGRITGVNFEVCD